jgi:hypothetical protein
METKLTGIILATPAQLEAYKTALSDMGCEVITTIGIPDINGQPNYRYEIRFSYTDAFQVFHAGKLVETYQAYLPAITTPV